MMTIQEYDSLEFWKARRKRLYVDDEGRPEKWRNYWESVLSNDDVARTVWNEKRKGYNFQLKQEQITHALETLKANGIKAYLMCYDNQHIMARSKSGKKMSYYAGTGTIAGYRDTTIEGLDEYIRLLKTI